MGMTFVRMNFIGLFAYFRGTGSIIRDVQEYEQMGKAHYADPNLSVSCGDVLNGRHRMPVHIDHVVKKPDGQVG
jgi:hypothetical protein